LYLIAAAGHAEHALRRACGAGVQIGAKVSDNFDFQPQNLAVFSKRHFRCHRLIAPLDGGDKIFTPGGDPFDRLLELQREMACNNVLAIDRSLAAKPATNVRRVEANPVFRKTQSVGDLGARAVGPLGRQPDGELLAAWIGADDDTARFHSERYLPRAGDVHGEHVIRLRKRFFDIAAVFD
jgi:hypothetical protein